MNKALLWQIKKVLGFYGPMTVYQIGQRLAMISVTATEEEVEEICESPEWGIKPATGFGDKKAFKL